MGWIAAAGLCAGLAAQTKLNGGTAAAGAWLVVMLAAARRQASWRSKARDLLPATIILAASAAGAFLGTNPSLWPHPPRESLRMVRARAEVMNAQVLQFRHEAIVGAGASLAALGSWLRARHDNHARVVLTVVGAIVSAPGLFTPLD